jgi:heme-degrading monooxygenase HmoA
MFIAMNQFKVNPGQEEEFERRWRERETYLDSVPGFLQFALLRGDIQGDYVSHTVWEDRAAFDAWTKSEAFTAGHRQGGSMAGILATHPEPRMFEAVLVQRKGEPVAGGGVRCQVSGAAA